MQEELRIALVMNGGVSLAVWIGGVTLEIGRLLARSSGYGQLQDLTSTSTRVDVICGTSAGGINGAFLAMAMAHHRGDLDQSLSALRNLWVTKGSINALLRDPFAKDLRSFLDGDGFFLESLREAFQALKTANPSPPAEVPIDLVITTTLLRGMRKEFSDDFGSRLVDVNHRGRFRFSRGPRERKDPFAESTIADQLALAARSTASFPAAFEASFCPVGETTNKPARPDMSGIANFSTSRFVIDGGVLDNSPVDIALERIYRQRADGPVRRVLAYVIPDPGTTARPHQGKGDEDRADEVDEAPELLEVALASLVQIPGVQSISAQLEELRQHNERVRERREARILLTTYNSPAEIDQLAAMLFDAYRALRVTTAIGYIVGEIGAGLLAKGNLGLGHRGRREWLRRAICAREKELPWVPKSAPNSTEAIEEVSIDRWRWGTRPVEHLARVLLDVVIRTQRLVVVVPQQTSLSVIWNDAFDILEATERLRGADRDYWKHQAEQVVTFLGDGKQGLGDGKQGINVDERAQTWFTTAIMGWQRAPLDPALSKEGASGNAYQLAAKLLHRIAACMLALRPIIAVTEATIDRMDDPMLSRQLGDLVRLHGYFVRQATDVVETVVKRLLSFEVIQEALGGRGTLTEQELEFVQISARSASTFGGSDDPAQKLAGVQLAHFGAFYRSSWRANDWLWGRLDAVQRLVRLVLDPERLRIVAQIKFPVGKRASHVAAAIERIAIDTDLPGLRLVLSKSWDADAIVKELAYLDDPRIIVPERLPIAVEAVSRRLEGEILIEELPLISGAIENDRDNGANISETVQSFLTRCPSTGQPSADQLRSLLSICDLGKERLEHEIGTDRLTWVATQAAAVAVSSVHSQKGLLAILGKMLAVLRAPSLLFYVYARNAHMGWRTGVTVNAAVFGAGAVIVLTQLFKQGTYDQWLLVLGLAGLGAPVLLGALRWPGAGRKIAAAAIAIGLIYVVGFFLGIAPLPELEIDTWRKIAVSAVTLLLLAFVTRI